MKTLDATSRAGVAVALAVLSAALSGCYYYVPYGYVPYGTVPAPADQQQYAFSVAGATGAVTSDAIASTNTYAAPAVPVFVAPAYYPVAYPYPYYGSPAWWGPSVSLSFGYWGGCCYGGGRYGYWGHHGYWGHGYRGGWGGHGSWGGHGYHGQGMGGGRYWGGGGGGGHGHSH
ncbi:hypothetical protein [Paraburkholderia xenovorans]|uniref:hypothetical protein n=1 Tax=Paraburkholderia xenovorans TaxID=36873 RepID=UPI0038BD83B8